jgi:hypothetical protein
MIVEMTKEELQLLLDAHKPRQPFVPCVETVKPLPSKMVYDARTNDWVVVGLEDGKDLSK